MAVTNYPFNVSGVIRGTESLAAANAALTLSDVRAAVAACVQVSGTFSATLVFEVSNDGTTWTAVAARTPTSSAQITSVTAPGLVFVLLGGAVQFRVRVSAYTSGTAVVDLGTCGAAAFDLASSAGGAVDTELPAAALLSDSVATPTAPAVGSFNHLYDPFIDRWHPERGNREVALLGKQNRTATATSAMQINRNSKGLILHIDVDTLVDGTLTFRVYNRADAANVFGEAPLIVSSAIAVPGQYFAMAYPGLTNPTVPTGYNQAVNGILSKHWYCDCTQSSSSVSNYGVSAIEMI